VATTRRTSRPNGKSLFSVVSAFNAEMFRRSRLTPLCSSALEFQTPICSQRSQRRHAYYPPGLSRLSLHQRKPYKDIVFRRQLGIKQATGLAKDRTKQQCGYTSLLATTLIFYFSHCINSVLSVVLVHVKYVLLSTNTTTTTHDCFKMQLPICIVVYKEQYNSR